jgi:insertion element IS1 protein InsB
MVLQGGPGAQQNQVISSRMNNWYGQVIPATQHRAISKCARKTNHIERFNNTPRQRVSRLARDALAFSKKLVDHIGAIKLFICHYNLTRAAA